MSKITLEYVWIDGQKPTAKLRSKTKVINDIDLPDIFLPYSLENQNKVKIPVWGFDGSSTEQAVGTSSDCVLQPVKLYKDPLRQNGYVVLCEVFNVDGTPHESNKRYKLREVYEQYKQFEPLFGIEQEYTLMVGTRPLGFPEGGYPAPQGKYYCGVGADEVYGREIVEEHLQVCLDMKLLIEGINAEVMPGQWEFQIGTGTPLEVSDDLWIGRYMLYRVAAKYNISATLDPKPVKGDWNGAGAHVNFSTNEMREKYEYIIKGINKLGERHTNHIDVYGEDNDQRLTGAHETCSIDEFKYGVSDRSASIRIPWQVHKNQRGYLEDRRPAANIDPYRVTRKIIKTVCVNETCYIK